MCDAVQERLVAATSRPRLIHQHLRDLYAVTGMEIVEAEHRGEHPIDRRRSSGRSAGGEHDHVVGRLAQPARELTDLLQRHAIPRDARRPQKHEVRLQIHRVSAHRVRRPLDMRQPRQEALDRHERAMVIADHRRRLPPRRREDALDSHPAGRSTQTPSEGVGAIARRVQPASATLRVAPPSRTRMTSTS